MFNSLTYTNVGCDKILAWKTKNNMPMPQEEAYARIRAYGYEPIDKYVNNRTRMQCYDKDGYIIKLSLDSLGRCNSYQRFSSTANSENFISNLQKYGKECGYESIPIDFYPSKTRNHVVLKCRCSCGQIFDVDANLWRRGEKTRCNSCVHNISNIEKAVKDYLDLNNIEYVWQYMFENCRDKRRLPFDFYLPEFNICIEVDGEQHFHRRGIYDKGKNTFEDRIKKDKIKTDYCANNNIKLIRLRYNVVRNNKFIEILNKELNIHRD